jgi:glutaredoxin-like YruB-family protein
MLTSHAGVESGNIFFNLTAEANILCFTMPTLIIYTQPTCGYCQELKDYLKKNNIEYQEKDITKDRAAWDELVNKYKARATPLVVYGEKSMLGFNPDDLQKMIGAEQAPAK